MEANVTGAYANNTNQSASTSANATATNAFESNVSLSTKRRHCSATKFPAITSTLSLTFV